MDSSYWPYAAIVLLIALSAFFSGSEIAFASANKMRLKKGAAEKGLRERVAYDISEDYNNALSSILIGNNLVNIAASSVATVIAMSIFGENSSLGPTAATVVMTVLVLIFGEIAPKIVAKKNADSFSVAVALPLRLVMAVLRPVNVVVLWVLRQFEKLWGKTEEPSMTEEELASIIEIIEDEGVIDEEQSELLQSALEFSDITAQEILKPRVDMVAIDIDDDFEENKKLIFDVPFSRIPVYRGTIDNIIGILYVDHFFKKLIDQPDMTDFEDILMPPCFIHKTMKLPAVMAQLRSHQMHLAIVVDEYGGTSGLITLEDLLEELVGNIYDEFDPQEEKDIEKVGDNLWRVAGSCELERVAEATGVQFPEDEESDTLGGLVFAQLSFIPEDGSQFTVDACGLHIEVQSFNERRVEWALVSRLPEEETPEEQEK